MRHGNPPAACGGRFVPSPKSHLHTIHSPHCDGYDFSHGGRLFVPVEWRGTLPHRSGNWRKKEWPEGQPQRIDTPEKPAHEQLIQVPGYKKYLRKAEKRSRRLHLSSLEGSGRHFLRTSGKPAKGLQGPQVIKAIMGERPPEKKS